MQQFIVFVHWTDRDDGRNSLGVHINAPNIDAACEALERRVRAEEPFVANLWSYATDDV